MAAKFISDAEQKKVLWWMVHFVHPFLSVPLSVATEALGQSAAELNDLSSFLASLSASPTSADPSLGNSSALDAALANDGGGPKSSSTASRNRQRKRGGGGRKQTRKRQRMGVAKVPVGEVAPEDGSATSDEEDVEMGEGPPAKAEDAGAGVVPEEENKANKEDEAGSGPKSSPLPLKPVSDPADPEFPPPESFPLPGMYIILDLCLYLCTPGVFLCVQPGGVGL